MNFASGLMAALTGAGQGFLQGQQHAEEEYQKERANKLSLYKMIAEANPELANTAMQMDPHFKDVASPLLNAQQQAFDSKKQAIMADPQYDPEAAAKGVKYQPIQAPQGIKALFPALGKAYEQHVNTAPGLKNVRERNFQTAQDTARQEATKKRDEAIAGLGDPTKLRFFANKEPMKIQGGQYVIPYKPDGTLDVANAKYLTDVDEIKKAELSGQYAIAGKQIEQQGQDRRTQYTQGEENKREAARLTTQVQMNNADNSTSILNTTANINARATLQDKRLSQSKDLAILADKRARDLAALKQQAGSDATKLAKLKLQIATERRQLDADANAIRNNILNDPDSGPIQAQLQTVQARLADLDVLEKSIPGALPAGLSGVTTAAPVQPAAAPAQNAQPAGGPAKVQSSKPAAGLTQTTKQTTVDRLASVLPPEVFKNPPKKQQPKPKASPKPTK